MVRQIIHIDEEKCNGCGLCARACHESAIGIVNGKAKLLRDDYCDGMGDCLPNCPTGAISFEQREAADYDAEAVEKNKKKNAILQKIHALTGGAAASKQADSCSNGTAAKKTGGCPGSASRQITRNHMESTGKKATEANGTAINGTSINGTLSGSKEETAVPEAASAPSQLTNWPVQIKLAPITAPYFNGADLLIAADCTAYSYASFHQDFIRNRVTLIGCPKLDSVDYSEKLSRIFAENAIMSITMTRMEVPCCGGLEKAVLRAIKASGKNIPCKVYTIGIEGDILKES